MSDVTLRRPRRRRRTVLGDPGLTARVGVVARGRPGARDRAALPGAHRAAAAGLHRRRGRRADRPVRTARTLGQHSAHVPVAAQHRDGAGVHRQHPGRSPARVHLRLRGHRGQVPARACATAPSRCSSSSAERFSPRDSSGFSVQQVPWDCEDALRPAGRGMARSDRSSTIPNSGWVRLDHDTRHGAGRLQVGARPVRPR